MFSFENEPKSVEIAILFARVRFHSKNGHKLTFLVENIFSYSFFSFKLPQLYFEFELWSHCISIGISFKRFQKKPRVKWAIWTWLFDFLKRKIIPDWRSKPVILKLWISILFNSDKKYRHYEDTGSSPEVIEFILVS